MDIVGLSSTTVTQSAWKSVEFCEKMQNKGYYGVQDHSKVIEVGTNRKPCNFLLAINSNFDILSRTVSGLSQLSVQISGTLRFRATLWGLRTTYDVHLGLIGKRVVDFILVLIELFSLGVTAESLRAKRDRNRRFRSNAATLIQNCR